MNAANAQASDSYTAKLEEHANTLMAICKRNGAMADPGFLAVAIELLRLVNEMKRTTATREST